MARSEKDGIQVVSVENSMSYVHSSKGNLEPISSELKSECAIISEIAEKTLSGRKELPHVDWKKLRSDYSLIRDLIEKSIPGFKDYNKRLEDGFYLPHSVRDNQGFNTPEGKALFTLHEIPELGLKKDQYLMMTIRTHDQFNTTIYDKNDRYRGVYGQRRIIFMNPLDMEKEGFSEKEKLTIISHFKGQTRVVKNFQVVPYDIPLKCTATYFPESNELVHLENHAKKSYTPVSKSIVVTLERS